MAKKQSFFQTISHQINNAVQKLSSKPKVVKAPLQMNKAEEGFYTYALKKLKESGVPFLVGGTYALTLHTGLRRDTKDLDIFCKASDYPAILNVFEKDGFKAVIDERWLLKLYKGNDFIDVIFSTVNGLVPVDDSWFKNNPVVELFGSKVKIIRADDMIWSKSFRQERHKYDGPDINHLLLKKPKEIDWNRLMTRMEPYWEILFAHLLNFRFVYPGYRQNIPKWVMEELIKRQTDQLRTPAPINKISRGRLISPSYYDIDFDEWGFVDNLFLSKEYGDKNAH